MNNVGVFQPIGRRLLQCVGSFTAFHIVFQVCGAKYPWKVHVNVEFSVKQKNLETPQNTDRLNSLVDLLVLLLVLIHLCRNTVLVANPLLIRQLYMCSQSQSLDKSQCRFEGWLRSKKLRANSITSSDVINKQLYVTVFFKAFLRR